MLPAALSAALPGAPHMIPIFAGRAFGMLALSSEARTINPTPPIGPTQPPLRWCGCHSCVALHPDSSALAFLTAAPAVWAGVVRGR